MLEGAMRQALLKAEAEKRAQYEADCEVTRQEEKRRLRALVETAARLQRERIAVAMLAYGIDTKAQRFILATDAPSFESVLEQIEKAAVEAIK